MIAFKPAVPVLCALLLAALPAAARAQHEGLTRWIETADRFESLLVASAARGAPVTASDPEAALLLRTLTDGSATFDNAPLEDGRTYKSFEILGRVSRIASLYAEFETEGLSATARRDRMNRNLITYQEEIFAFFTFNADAWGFVVRSFERTVAQAPRETLTEDRVGGARQFRSAVVQSVTGLIMVMTADGITPENKLAFAAALERNSPTFASAMTLAQRDEVMITVRRVRLHPAMTPDVRAAFDRAFQPFMSASCTGLCAL